MPLAQHEVVICPRCGPPELSPSYAVMVTMARNPIARTHSATPSFSTKTGGDIAAQPSRRELVLSRGVTRTVSAKVAFSGFWNSDFDP
jgi:hypothetical protein